MSTNSIVKLAEKLEISQMFAARAIICHLWIITGWVLLALRPEKYWSFGPLIIAIMADISLIIDQREADKLTALLYESLEKP